MDTSRKSALLVCTAALLFSFTGLTGKWMPWSAYSMAGFRAIVAFFVIAGFRRSFKVKLNWKNIAGGASVTLTSVLFLVANKLTTAANAIVLQYAMPVFVILLCAVFYRQKPTRRDLTAAGCVLAGIILCFAGSLGGGSLLGDLLALASAFTYSFVFFAAKLEDCDAFSYTYLGMAMTSVFAVNMFFDPAVTAEPLPWLVGVLMGLLLSAGYLCFASGMRRISPVTAAILSNVEPVMNPIWVFLALGETPGIFSILGAVVVLGTVTVYSLPKRKIA